MYDGLREGLSKDYKFYFDMAESSERPHCQTAAYDGCDEADYGEVKNY